MRRRRIVFHFYVPQNWRDIRVIRLHLNCLAYYSFIFDEATFIISVDDESNEALIAEFEHEILNCGFINVRFKVMNNYYSLYEATTLYNEILNKLNDLYGLTFFGHSKGIGNEIFGQANFDQLFEWICGLYFLTLDEYNVAQGNLLGYRGISYGPYKYLNEDVTNNKYGWMYSGTFFWLNARKLDEYLKQKRIKIEPPFDRFFSEQLLGNIIPYEEDDVYAKYAESRNGLSLKGRRDFYGHVTEYTPELLNIEEYKDFISFKEKMTKDLL